MFYGEHEHTIDRKGRLIIPAKFRAVLKENAVERLFLTRGLDGCLFLFTEEEWRRQESKFKGISFTRGEARKFNRLYFSGAVEAERFFRRSARPSRSGSMRCDVLARA